MPAALKLDGLEFGRLTIIRRGDKTKAGKLRWVCKCECGNEVSVISSRLKNGHTKSCGCAQKDAVRLMATTHGCTRTQEYRAWACMIRRTTVEKVERFKHYGGRGIVVCERWRDSFENFLVDMGMKPTPKHSIDRVNNDIGYSPENCRWATPKEQMRNTTRSRRITYKKETRCLSEWADIVGIRYYTLFSRIMKYGWSVEKAFETPPGGHRK